MTRAQPTRRLAKLAILSRRRRGPSPAADAPVARAEDVAHGTREAEGTTEEPDYLLLSYGLAKQDETRVPSIYLPLGSAPEKTDRHLDPSLG